MTRILLAALLLGCLLACPSCGDPREAAIEASFYDLENAMNWEDGDTAVALYSAESFTVCDALLTHALESDAATVRRLAPSAIGEIFTMRNRCDREQIEQMNGRAWIKYATEQGWYQYEEDPDRPEYVFDIGAIQIAPDGDSAVVEVLIGGERLQRRLDYVHEDDRWKRHLKSELDVVDELIRQWVSDTRLSVYELLTMWEMEEHGDVRDDLWEPMRSRRR